ncbi:MAG: calcium/sodium antiporter [Desulfobacterales bacterium]|nr:calcium/sodium antiporter [Desulfobacterales bacterium]
MLYFCADWLVKGSSSLARSLGLTPIAIGLTVVAFGTSAPEMVVSVISSVKGKSMIAVGNVIGSNICNIGMVLGLAAVFKPILGAGKVVSRDMPLTLAVSLLLLFISMDSRIGRVEGACLFSGLITYICFNYYTALKETRNDSEVIDEIVDYSDSRARQILLIVAGIAGVVVGAEIVIDSAMIIMKALGATEKFIGVTVIALGTSLPELATSLVAILNNETDISVGNLLGSNVFNILGVLGAAALIRPIPIPGGFVESGLLLDYSVMIIICFLPWLIMKKNGILGRKDGFVLLAAYIGYILYLTITMNPGA